MCEIGACHCVMHVSIKEPTKFVMMFDPIIQVLIPVSGSKLCGLLKSNATVRNGEWEVDSVVLKFNNRPEEICLLDNTKMDGC